MEWKRSAFDWNQARAFLATAEEGSLSAAARALGLTQPTLSRQVAGLEEALGVTLFERTSRALLLTQAGTQLLEHFQSMREAANRVSITATGQSEAVTGRVVIACTNGMATFFLPMIFKKLQAVAPDLKIEIIASNEIITRHSPIHVIFCNLPCSPTVDRSPRWKVLSKWNRAPKRIQMGPIFLELRPPDPI